MLISLGILIVLPAGLLIGIWTAPSKSKFEWLLNVLATTAIIAWIPSFAYPCGTGWRRGADYV
jgi:hypothetical protein